MSLQLGILLCGTVLAILQVNQRQQQPTLFPAQPQLRNPIQERRNILNEGIIYPPINNPKSPPFPTFNPHKIGVEQETTKGHNFQFNPHLKGRPVAQTPTIPQFSRPPIINHFAPKVPNNANIHSHHHSPPPANAQLIQLQVDPSGNFCTDGIRVRKEFRDLTVEEWRIFKETLIKMYEKKDDSIPSLIDRIVKVHLDWAEFAHYTPYFLLWHRVFTWLMETEMRKISPGITIPYWYWPYDARNPNKSPIFHEFYLGTKTGPMGDCRWRASYPEKHCLVRNYRVLRGFYSEKTVNKLVYNKKLSFAEFAKKFEVGPHGIVHTEIGGEDGDMTDMASPYDPIFWLHHSQVEKIFLEWQVYRGRIDEFGGTFLGRKVKLTDYLEPFKISIADALDYQKFCTVYQPFSRLAISPIAIKDLNQTDIGGGDQEIEESEERIPIGELPVSWIQMLGMEEAEARAIEAELRSYEEAEEMKSNTPSIAEGNTGEQKDSHPSFKLEKRPNLLVLCGFSISILLGMIGVSIVICKRLKSQK